jgi:hypothetical protein
MIWFLTIILVVCSLATAKEEVMDPPNSAAIFEQARISQHRVLFKQDFEGPVPEDYMRLWYVHPTAQCKMIFAGITEEQAFTGKRSYKVQIEFQPTGVPKAYIRTRLQIPIWSALKLNWRIKTETSPKVSAIHGSHGFSNGIAGGTDGNVSGGTGAKVSEENGWELWQASELFGGLNVEEYASGLSLYLQLGPISEVTVVTFYIDDITIKGKLQSDWEKQWADVYRYYTVYADRDRRSTADSRLTDVKAWQAELQKRYSALSAPEGAPVLLLEQYNVTVAKVKESLDKAAPLAAAVEKGLADKDASFTANIHSAELPLMEARYYMDVAEAYLSYARNNRQPDYLTFTLDVTQSYPILPGGPNAHREELSYYGWGAVVDFENHQLLPNTNPVPAKPSRSLTGFGCRGIYVPYSFALRSGKEMQDIVFTVSDLKSGKNRIPASQADIRVASALYLPWGESSRLLNAILLHDPEFVVPISKEEGNKFKDIKYGSDADKLQPVTIPAGTTRQFYLLVKVPDKATTGMYEGTVTGRADDGTVVTWSLALEVLPFDLEPTPYAYSAFCRSWVRGEEQKKSQGIHGWYKTHAQMEAEYINMGQHGLNTLNLYDGTVVRADDEKLRTAYPEPVPANAWNFSELDIRLAAAKRAGLTRTPFVWLGHGVGFGGSDDDVKFINQYVPAINQFCRSKGYPLPAYFGPDEAHGERLIGLKRGYEAVNKAGGIATSACYSDYFNALGTAMTLPILFGGVSSPSTEKIVRATQAAGSEVWIYNTPASNMLASPSVYRRRYGLSMWKNGENGATPWAYGDMETYNLAKLGRTAFCFTFPTWNGKPIDTIIYEAYREGIYDTRYMATLEKYLNQAKKNNTTPQLVSVIEKWLANFSVHEDLGKVRRQMADYTIKLMCALKL